MAEKYFWPKKENYFRRFSKAIETMKNALLLST